MTQIPTLTRVPGLPDPLRRISLPDDLEAVTTVGDDPESGGLDEAAVGRIWRTRSISTAAERIQPCRRACAREGAVVLNRAIGHARGNGPRDGDEVEKVLATPETPFVTYSGSRAVTALVVHLLAERGVLDLNDPVARYIPEYASGVKQDIAIAHVLAHRSGVPTMPPEAFDLDRVEDREFILRTLCEAKPGEFLADHAVSGGFILAEVVQRATGKDIRAVPREETLGPLRLRWGRLRGPAPGHPGARPRLRDRAARASAPLAAG